MSNDIETARQKARAALRNRAEPRREDVPLASSSFTFPEPKHEMEALVERISRMKGRLYEGTIVSDANDKTVVVRVERAFTHPVMKKSVRRARMYRAIDADNAHKVGDSVLIQKIPSDRSWVVIADAPAR